MHDMLAGRPSLASLPSSGSLAAMFGSLVLICWFLMLVFQGEGIELDLQRRRYPIWEWLLSHPIRPGAMFLAEMLSPVAANPASLGVPLLPGILYGVMYGPLFGALAAFLVGVPLMAAGACLSKALEIGVMLRFSHRTRGAVLGIMGWAGYALTWLLVVTAFVGQDLFRAIGPWLDTFTSLSWPWLELFLGRRLTGMFSFPLGVLRCWLGCSVAVVAAVGFSVWGAQQSIAGNPDRRPPRPRATASFGKQPLFRKELLWFRRDPGAIVQVVLIPLTLAGFQLFNLRGLISSATSAWNFLCGAAILFGTYFLWVLGPRSLASEGAALWIALSWPQGLENLLRAKARLWALIASALVGSILCYTALRFPGNLWQIALVGIGWIIFARSMAEKAVTLVSVASASGEVQKVSWGRQFATQLGMLTFTIGVLSQQWWLAGRGIVYSIVSAAAMWQNFRARLPFLYDPWSERPPPAPTLMHAMIAIGVLVDCNAVVAGVVTAAAGNKDAVLALPAIYAVCAGFVALGMCTFLETRGVTLTDIFIWDRTRKFDRPTLRLLRALVLGVAAGLLLGLLARGYLALLQLLPLSPETFRHLSEQMTQPQDPNAFYGVAILAVLLAPPAEEFLFRGLLYRALDREWGGWHAVLGSATFFAIYHQPLAWLPVGLVGTANALLFRRTGQLGSAIALHAVYNAVVVGWDRFLPGS
jgi:membrane protease YdiL (CAAX protease family)